MNSETPPKLSPEYIVRPDTGRRDLPIEIVADRQDALATCARLGLMHKNAYGITTIHPLDQQALPFSGDLEAIKDDLGLMAMRIDLTERQTTDKEALTYLAAMKEDLVAAVRLLSAVSDVNKLYEATRNEPTGDAG